MKIKGFLNQSLAAGYVIIGWNERKKLGESLPNSIALQSGLHLDIHMLLSFLVIL
jgi:hypothetical protein